MFVEFDILICKKYKIFKEDIVRINIPSWLDALVQSVSG